MSTPVGAPQTTCEIHDRSSFFNNQKHKPNEKQ